jgi:hypothetical protein
MRSLKRRTRRRKRDGAAIKNYLFCKFILRRNVQSRFAPLLLLELRGKSIAAAAATAAHAK